MIQSQNQLLKSISQGNDGILAEQLNSQLLGKNTQDLYAKTWFEIRLKEPKGSKTEKTSTAIRYFIKRIKNQLGRRNYLRQNKY